MAHVLILGGGFGGLAAAHELRSMQPDIEITVVDRGGRFSMGFAKLWDLAGSRPIGLGTRSLSVLEDHGIHVVQADIDEVDPEQRSVVAMGRPIEGDALLVALGDAPSPAHLGLLGMRGHNLYDRDSLPAMHRSLDTITEGQVLVAILGTPFKCPPAPYEGALVIDERLRARGVRDAVSVTISTPQPMTLPAAGPDASRYVAAHLDDRGIELLDRRAVQAYDPEAATVTFDDGSTMRVDVLFGVPASTPIGVLRESALSGPSGWIEPDRGTFRTSFERVYAVGDCTHVPTAKGALPKAGVFAAAQGRIAARNIVADLYGGDDAVFDGHGYCFLEVPGDRVAFVEGDFYAEPEPDVRIVPADEEQFRRKQAFETDLLTSWFG
jgi:sulfide:quinone oxidoreductase